MPSSGFLACKLSLMELVFELKHAHNRLWTIGAVSKRQMVIKRTTNNLNFESGAIAQLVRALPCHGRGCGFEPRWLREIFGIWHIVKGSLQSAYYLLFSRSITCYIEFLIGSFCLLSPIFFSIECFAQNEGQVLVRWYGHAFVYLISSTGVRVAIDPYGEDTVKYKFPDRLQADVVLISSESEDRSAGEKLFGTPQIFRSITAVGPNNARGHIFKGIQTFRDKSQGSLHGKNTAFVFKLDRVNFAHLGDLAHPLNQDQLAEFGRVDVLFLPIGNETLSNEELDKIALDLGARIIIPIAFKTTLSGDLDLRPLANYLEGKKNVRFIDSSEIMVSQSDLPSEPWIYVLKEP